MKFTQPISTIYRLAFLLKWSLYSLHSFTQVAVTPRFGGALRVTVYAPIWVVNKTGLPLVFRQEGSQAEAAGQESEHEVGLRIWLLYNFKIIF